MRVRQREIDEEIDLPVIDLETGEDVTGPRVHRRPPSTRRARIAHLAGVLLLVATGVSAIAVRDHRSVARLDQLWAEARVERAGLDFASRDLAEMVQVAMAAGEDGSRLTEARARSVEDVVERLERLRATIVGTVVVTPDARRLRAAMLAELDAWRAELTESTVAAGRFVPRADVAALDEEIGAARRRYRTSAPVVVARRPQPAVVELERLTKPVDAPLDATITALLEDGERLDIDLRTGATTKVTVAGLDPVRLPEGPALRSAGRIGDQLVFEVPGDRSVSVVLLPVVSSGRITRRIDDAFLPFNAQGAWVMRYREWPVAISLLDGREVRLPVNAGLVASTDDALVLQLWEGGDDGRPRTALFDLETQQLVSVEGEGLLMSGRGDVQVWFDDDRLLVDRAGDRSAMALPRDGFVQQVLLSRDGTLAALFDVEGHRTRLAVAGPTATELAAAVDLQGYPSHLSTRGPYIAVGSSFGAVRVYDTRTKAITVVRLPPGVVGFAVH